MIHLMVVAVGCLVGIDDGPRLPSVSYDEIKAKTGRDADAQVRLALWCEAHGFERERLKHLAVAVMTDPSNAMARGLMGLVEYQGKWRKPEAVAEAMKADLAAADLLAEYNGRRVRTPVKADPQWKLAQWCREKGLVAESRAHLATVVRLDPNHADAWKALGYRKVGQRWVTDAQAAAEKAEHAAQAKADKEWRPRLERLREALAIKSRKDDADREIATITDARAVPSVWKVFVERGGPNQLTAVLLLGQIDAAGASRGLALLAVDSRSDEVRRRATETLRRRDPREYADLLIMRLQEKIKYEVKHVGGPGSTGVLYVEGKEANLKRLYSPSAPDIAYLPGDTMDRDAAGNPILVHHQYQQVQQYAGEGSFAGNPFGAWAPLPGASAKNESNAARLRSRLPQGVPTNLESLESLAQGSDMVSQLQSSQAMNTTIVGRGVGNMADVNIYRDSQTRVPIGRMMAEADRVANTAEQQLKADFAVLEDYNARVVEANERVGRVLTAATGETLPSEPKPWRVWFVDQLGFKYNLPTPDVTTTVIENVPINDQARPIPVEVSTGTLIEFRRHSCFGKGTLIRTISGPRPIEELNIGDRVLSQDTRNGRLSYRPVVMAHHNPPSPTFRVSLGDDAIVTSPSHRFWKAGQGWVMARDLKVGDPIRTLGGVSKVTAIEADKVQPVFNLDVADDADFFAGSTAALVHDNTLPDLRQTPFDAAPAVATAR